MRQKQIEKMVRIFQTDDTTQTIVIKDESNFAIFCKYMENIVYTISKITIWIGICILLSCGVNAIVNPQIRDILFKQILGGL